MNRSRRIQLEDVNPSASVRFLAGLHVSLEEGKTSSIVTIIRTGSFNHPKYGRFDVTRELLEQMVGNFEARTYGQDIFIDVAHKPEDGAAGEIKRLFVEGNRLRALVEWTEYGIKAIQKRGFRYLSADYWENWQDNEEGNKHGALLAGAGLVTRPHIKRMEPVQLAESSDGIPYVMHPQLSDKLLQEARTEMNKHLKKLREQLEAKKLSEKVITAILNVAEAQMKSLGEDDEAMAAVATQLAEAGDTVAEQIAAGNSEISITLNQAHGNGKTLTEADIKRILAEQKDAEAKALADANTQRDANLKILTEAIGGQEAFSDELKKDLTEAVQDLVTADMSEDQVKRLADAQIGMGNKIAAQAELAARGFQLGGPAGSVRISLDESNNVKKLQEHADRRLGITAMGDSRRFAATGGALNDANKELAEAVLADFDRRNAHRLAEEGKQLAAGDGNVSDVVLPTTFERTVIREALYMLKGAMLVDSGSVDFGTVIEIPYSYRDITAAGVNGVRRYEGQGIQRAGVVQTTCEARPIPQKLAFLVSDELRYLMQAGRINWDAVAENRSNASRIVAEDTDLLLHNEILNASDEYSTAAVSNENIAGSFDGSKTIFPLAQWPVVRPRKEYNLKGTQVGSTINPITVTYDSQAREEYDGTGNQAAGVYYVMSYNHGEISFVDETGAPIAPAAIVPCTVSYSYTANVAKFDIDLGGATAKAHWDTFLYQFGLRKNAIQDDRFYGCNFAAMSGNVMTMIEQAETFGANFMKPGTDLAANGDLGRIKDVAGFRTAAPGIALGDQRIVMGERGTTRFRMAKPWSMGELENERDANGLFTGEKQSYGDQFIVVKTPDPLRAAYTSMALYSATARVAR